MLRHMKLFLKILWVVLALAAALSVAVVVRIVNPSEKVNALWIVTASACFYILMYRFYGAFLAAKVLALDGRTGPRRIGSATGPITTLPISGCFSATTSLPSPVPGRSSGPCWRCSSATFPDSYGSSSAPPWRAPCTIW